MATFSHHGQVGLIYFAMQSSFVHSCKRKIPYALIPTYKNMVKNGKFIQPRVQHGRKRRFPKPHTHSSGGFHKKNALKIMVGFEA